MQDSLQRNASIQTESIFCTACGASMTCGALRDVDECWCKTFPRLPENEVISDEGCICPSCLGRRLEVILQKEIEAHGVDGLISLAQPALPDANTAIPECHALEEFIDYRLEDGAYVFSAWFHLKRGYCCGSGCRNCPFD